MSGGGSLPISGGMGQAHYPWRPLGTLLVERGLLTEGEVDEALAEQRESGRLLGQILVDGCYLSGFSLTRALVEQHGLELRSAAPDPAPRRAPIASAARPWRPLGRLLVQRGLVTEAVITRALREQQERRGRLGEILVAGGHLTGTVLARTLAEQHGIDSVPELDDSVDTVLRPAAPEEPVYQVWASPFSLLCESTNFLDVADLASELVERRSPAMLEIRRVAGGLSETVWTYSEDEPNAPRPTLVQTFGFDPTRWAAR